MGKQKDARCEKCRTDGTLLLMQASSPFYTCANSTCSLHIPVSCAVAPMTRQMADDEVLRVLDDAAYELHNYTPDAPQPMRDVRAYVAALQAERDADKAALEALRGQVAGLVGGLRTQADRAEQRSEQKFAEGVADIAAQESGCAMTARHCAAHLDALLAIKERMG